LLIGQIDVENPDKNYRFSNIELTATFTHTMCIRDVECTCSV